MRDSPYLSEIFLTYYITYVAKISLSLYLKSTEVNNHDVIFACFFSFQALLITCTSPPSRDVKINLQEKTPSIQMSVGH